MARLILGAIIVLIALTAYAVIECALAQSSRVRSITKTSWFFVIVLLPVIGPTLWFVFGRPRNAGSAGRASKRPTGPIAPDDDAEFLRNLDNRRRNEQRARELDERERKLRERESDQ